MLRLFQNNSRLPSNHFYFNAAISILRCWINCLELNFLTSVLCCFFYFSLHWVIHNDVAFPTLMTFSILNLHFLLWWEAFSTLKTFLFLVLHFLRLDHISYLHVIFSTLMILSVLILNFLRWWHFLSWCCIFYLDDIFYFDVVFSTLMTFSILILHFLLWWHFLSWCCIFYLDDIFNLDFAFSTLMYNILYLDDISYFGVAFFMHWWYFLPAIISAVNLTRQVNICVPNAQDFL